MKMRSGILSLLLLLSSSEAFIAAPPRHRVMPRRAAMRSLVRPSTQSRSHNPDSSIAEPQPRLPFFAPVTCAGCCIDGRPRGPERERGDQPRGHWQHEPQAGQPDGVEDVEGQTGDARRVHH